MPREQFTVEQAREFARAADPHAWFLCADLIHSQAVALRSRPRRGHLTFKSPSSATATWDEDSKAIFLLCAVALENAIKAFLVYEFPYLVADGHLNKEITNHRLATLADRSNYIPYRKRDRWLLERFEEGNESWMRYPCGKRASDLKPEPNMDELIWQTYTRVMRGYGKSLVRLLSKGWTSPLGDFNRWTFEGEFLGHFVSHPIQKESL